MPCPHCGDISNTFVSMYVDFRQEPYSFREGSVDHEHDFNPRICKWRCTNGHEYELMGRFRCSGCLIEQLMAFEGTQSSNKST